MPRQNILLIQTDSHDGRIMGCMGHPALKRATPNLDRLARRGVLFQNAYTNNPVCVPCRASMWSGQYTHHCEGWNNYKGLEPDTPTFLNHIDGAGYRSRIVGRTDHLSGKHTARARVTAWTRSANILRPAYNESAPEIIESDEERVHERDWGWADETAAALHDFAADPGEPFFLYLGVGIPHPRFLTSRRYLDLIDEAGVTVPPEDENLLDHPVMNYRHVVMNWRHGYDDEMVKQVRRVYFAMVAELDAMMGVVFDALDATGLADSTTVIFTSDHGESAMEHRQWYKMSMYEPSARVPMIVAGPGLPEGETVDDPVSLIDIFPTLMDLADIEQPAGIDGHSLLPVARGEPNDHPDWVLSEFHDTPMNTSLWMLRRGDWKYIAYPGYEPQLFNLVEDPDEITNLVGLRPEVVAEMDRKLREIVDYEAVDAKVKAYDRAAFREWRDEQNAAGTYGDQMARIYSGFDRLPDDEVMPWTDKDEAQIERWLAEEPTI
jgi:arylsulfatase K